MDHDKGVGSSDGAGTVGLRVGSSDVDAVVLGYRVDGDLWILAEVDPPARAEIRTMEDGVVGRGPVTD